MKKMTKQEKETEKKTEPEQTLEELLAALGDRPVALCRELTKLHEESFRTTLGGAVAHYTENPPKGEFVLVLAGAEPREAATVTLDDAVAADQTFSILMGEKVEPRKEFIERNARYAVNLDY